MLQYCHVFIYYDQDCRFFDLILENLSFFNLKKTFQNKKEYVCQSKEILGFSSIEILGFSIEILGFLIEIPGFSEICDKWLP